MPRQRLIAPDHFGGLLALILAMFVLLPLAPDSAFGGVLVGLLAGALLVASLVVSGAGRHVVLLVAGATAVMVAVATTGALVEAGDDLPAWGSAIFTLLLVGAPVLVLRRVLEHETITLASVAGALCAYLLVGFAFASLYHTVELLDPGAYAPELGGASMYFSFVTLTTLGYGDFTAQTDLSRSLAALEAVLGQVLLVTLVARFVGSLGQQRARRARD